MRVSRLFLAKHDQPYLGEFFVTSKRCLQETAHVGALRQIARSSNQEEGIEDLLPHLIFRTANLLLEGRSLSCHLGLQVSHKLDLGSNHGPGRKSPP